MCVCERERGCEGLCNYSEAIGNMGDGVREMMCVTGGEGWWVTVVRL